MNKSNFISLDKKIEELKSLTAKLDIYKVANSLFHELITFGQTGNRVKLNSPARQSLYLLGVMSSQSICNTEDCTDEKMNKIYSLLNDIYSKYLNVYFPDKKDLEQGIDNSWFKTRHASMPAFLGYFFESKKIATDELRKDLLKTYEQFEDIIFDHFGLSHKDMIEITDRIGSILQNRIDYIYKILDEVNTKRLELANPDISDYSENVKAIQDSCGPLILELMRLSEEICIFKFDEIDDIAPAKLNLFKQHFVMKKGSANDIKYITDENSLETNPIITVDENNYAICSINFILLAIQNKIDQYFKESKFSERFRKARDMKLEQDAKEALSELLPENSIVLESVFENNKSSNEHDLVIISKRSILIIEAKATPRREPLREPSRAFTRIKDDFKKKSGIQSGCDQALNLKTLIEKNEITILYDKKGNVLHTISKQDFDDIYCICVTKDDFGLLATDLTILLDKPADEKYPWVINIDDLRFLISCLKYIGKDWLYFIEYLSQRVNLMGKIISADELDIAGAFLKYNGFKSINKDSPQLFLDISESTVFDEIHLAKLDGKAYTLKTTKPAFFEIDRQKIFSKTNKKSKDKKKREQKKARRRNRK
ncbi:TPA: NERD domain-containing protein [Klebsiella pneumoniae]|uniref:NERD domain-containing protein n=1 Tax=Klebsiella pneumoniae complex TaxID=3390273 RepID=UPI00164B3DB5|nr:MULTISPECIES: NERD domain-containing protein [Klebsiella]HDU4628835.1 NERD domain-containing protein [Klebsiella pneumoniae subsp. pneumoniae]MBC4804589.1 NERD domain-containing protein [Klebsiella quasipneumoniae]MBW3309461.1 NERD domain-containing protein [Klebsiella pneumoniae]MCB3775794.1 NERD domain-containing protein [Klebsiella pneumoniae]MDG0750706.1 NERD domain-containing protein [Klebsiella quasipneumoniae]